LSKSRRAFETEVENYRRNQKDLSDRMMRITAPNDPRNLDRAPTGEDSDGENSNVRSGLLKQK
jgi:hypothetical protein